jgi:cytochrome c biogenesis protein CcmG, thiol:disulfide interchange protein DsbE
MIQAAKRIPRRGRGPLLALVLIAGLVGAELLGGGSGGPTRTAPPLPAAVLFPPRVTIAGLGGKPAAINFWASWCGPCRQEAPQLERLSRSQHGQARLVGVDWNDGLASARAFVRRYRWSFPVLRDASGTVGEGYGVIGLPMTFILDSRGQIVETLRGPQTAQSIGQALSRAR